MKTIYKLLAGELSKARIACFLLTQVVGIAIIIVSLQFFFDIKEAINSSKQEEEYIILTKKVGTLSGLLSSNMSFSSKEIKKLKQIEGIGDIGEFSSSNFRVQASIGIRSMAVSYTTEMFFEAVDDQFIDVETNDWTFDEDSEFIPIIVPQNYINLYNFGFAPSSGLPKLSKDIIKSVSLDIRLTDKYGYPRNYKGKIVGFSGRINTILAPKSFVDWGNATLAEKKDDKAQRLIVKIDPSRTDSILEAIDNMGYELENKVFNYEKMSRIIAFIISITLVIGVVITALSIFLLILSLFLLIQRNKEKIFNLFILGFATSAVSKPYLKISLYMTTVSFILAYILATLVRFYYKTFMSEQLGLVEFKGVLWIPILIVIGLYVIVLTVNRFMISREICHIRR